LLWITLQAVPYFGVRKTHVPRRHMDCSVAGAITCVCSDGRTKFID
jgi:hypothetical protein